MQNGREQLGRRVRALRKRAGMTLQEVSLKTGLSNSTLSKIENGALSVSYDNLMKLANGLSSDLPSLFTGESDAPTLTNGLRSVTLAGRGEIYETPQYRYEMLQADLTAKKMIPIVATLRAHSIQPATDLIRHPGEEFVYVLEGTVTVHTEFYAPTTLKKGDSIHFDSSMSHGLISAGDRDAKILWVTTSMLPSIYKGTRTNAEGESDIGRRTHRRARVSPGE